MSISYKTADVDENGASEVTLRTSTGVELLGQLIASSSIPVVLASNHPPIAVTGISLVSGTPDQTSFLYGTTTEQPIGGVYQDTAPGLVAGTSGAIRATANRALHINLRDSSGNEVLSQKTMVASIPVVLASNQTAIPVNQGTPNSINSAWPVEITNGVQSLVINTDGSINVDSVTTSLTNMGRVFGVNLELNLPTTGEQNMLLLRNPLGSGKSLFINMTLYGSVDSITRYRIRMYQKPTVTSVGNAITIFPCLIKPSSPPVSVMLAYSSPVISSRGAKMRTYAREGTNSDIDVFNRSIDLAPGTDLLFTGDTDATNKVIAISLQWSEE